jgi:NAD(P)H-dependent FMN reductase
MHLMIRVAIVLGSMRPGLNGQAVSNWLEDIAATRKDVKFELVDIQDFMVSTPKISAYDAYVFVTPARDRGIAGALRNAMGYLYCFFNGKADRVAP